MSRSDNSDLSLLVVTAISESAKLELLIIEFLSILLFSRVEDGLNVIAGFKFNIVLQLFKAMFYAKVDGDELFFNDFDKLLIKIHRARSLRTPYAHGIWEIDNTSNHATMMIPEKETKNLKTIYNFDNQKVTRESITADIETIKKAIQAVLEYRERVLTENRIKYR